MSSLTKVLAEEVRKIEETAAVARTMQTNRLTHHLMPPVGWLNDPNGLCWYKGRYHVFFQYSPFEANGGLKFWGHYSSVLTGRGLLPLADLADLVTEMRPIKHYFDEGLLARQGIEY